MKKLCKLICLVAVLMMAFVITVSAESGGFIFYESDGKVYIEGYDGTVPENLVIPSTIDGKPVVGISDISYNMLENVKTLTIPDSVVSVTWWLWYENWEVLETVNIGSGFVGDLGGAFGSAMKLKAINISAGNPAYASKDGVVYTKDFGKMTTYPQGKTAWTTVPATVEDLSCLESLMAANIQIAAGSPYFYTVNGITYTIDGKTIVNCAPDKSGTLTITNTVTGFWESSFAGCDGLTKVVVPASVTEIAYNQFASCSSLKEIVVPASVQTIGATAFYNCESLEKVEITSIDAWCTTEFYDVYANPLFYAGNLYVNGQLVTNVQMPAGLEAVPDSVFAGASCLKTVTIPSSAKRIGHMAFYNCDGLTTLIVPNTVEWIGYQAYRDCDGLTTVTIPGTVETIASSAFANCGSLKNLQLGEGVLELSGSAFADCVSLEEVTLPASMEFVGWSCFSGCTALKKLTVKSDDVWFGSDVFQDCPLESVTLASGKTLLDDYMFAGSAMKGQYNIPSSVTEIGYRAFYDCDELTQITIPKSVTTIVISAFADCNNLQGIWVDGANPNYSSDSVGALYNKDKTQLMQLPGAYVGAYRVPEGVTEIDDRTFNGCVNLGAVTLPSTLEVLGGNAFSNSGVTQVYIPEGVTELKWNTFGDDTVKSVFLPKSLTYIGDAFGWSHCVEDVYYAGTQAQWEELTRYWGEQSFTVHYNATGIPGGWVKQGANWYYLYTNGSFATGWKQIGGAWYYFKTNGIMATGWQKLGGVYYYFNASGAMTTGWQKIDGQYYLFDANGVMQTGWKQVGKAYYYLKSSGEMVTGTVTINGVKHKFDANGVWQGEVKANGWTKEAGKWCYYKNGAKVTGWLDLGGTWYYFNPRGEMVTGWLAYGPVWYYFNADGAMYQGFMKYGGQWYFFNDIGRMHTGWAKVGGYWYYMDGNGYMVTGNKTIGGKLYRFNASGVCLNP